VNTLTPNFFKLHFNIIQKYGLSNLLNVSSLEGFLLNVAYAALIHVCVYIYIYEMYKWTEFLKKHSSNLLLCSAYVSARNTTTISEPLENDS